jgi:Transposase IS116/IS110/IS902 family
VVAARPLPACAREQITVALAMIDALDLQLAPRNKQLRAYARRQPGCRALMAHYGIGELTAVTILAELGDAGRFSSSREAVRYAGMDITVHQSDQRRAPGDLSRQGPPALRWALFEAASPPPVPAVPTVTTTARRRSGSAPIARACRWRASCSSAATTRSASSARRRCSPHEAVRARQALRHADAPRPAPGPLLPPRSRGRP